MTTSAPAVGSRSADVLGEVNIRRKTAVTRLERAGFGNKFINQMNRWRAQEQSKGRFV